MCLENTTFGLCSKNKYGGGTLVRSGKPQGTSIQIFWRQSSSGLPADLQEAPDPLLSLILTQPSPVHLSSQPDLRLSNLLHLRNSAALTTSLSLFPVLRQ
jgi:hypothetical protein